MSTTEVSLLEFARLTQARSVEAKIANNICPKCLIAMEIQNDEYVCTECLRIFTFADCHISSSQPFTRHKDIKRYASNDPLSEQYASIYDQLIARREEYITSRAKKLGIEYEPNSILTGTASAAIYALAPSTSVIISAIKQYMEIQRKAAETGKAFVKCGEVRDEVIALLIFMECSKTEQRSKREIAELVGLRTDGFSRGYGQLMHQVAAGNFVFDADDIICRDKTVALFKKTLGLYLDAKYGENSDTKMPAASKRVFHTILYNSFLQMIQHIVKASIENSICVKSRLQSKIVGTIWFIIRAMHYPISAKQIDAASRGIKRFTFLKFSRAIKARAKLRKIARFYIPTIGHGADIARITLN